MTVRRSMSYGGFLEGDERASFLATVTLESGQVIECPIGAAAAERIVRSSLPAGTELSRADLVHRLSLLWGDALDEDGPYAIHVEGVDGVWWSFPPRRVVSVQISDKNPDGSRVQPTVGFGRP